MVPQVRALVATAEPAGKGIGSLNTAASLDQFEGYCWVWTGRLADGLAAYELCIRQADVAGELAVLRAATRSRPTATGAIRSRPRSGHARRRRSACSWASRRCLPRGCMQANGHAHLAAGRVAEASAPRGQALAIHRRVDQTSAGPRPFCWPRPAGGGGQPRRTGSGDRGDRVVPAFAACQLRGHRLGRAGACLAACLGAMPLRRPRPALDAADALIKRTGALLLTRRHLAGRVVRRAGRRAAQPSGCSRPN
jgi:hypothetical protein